MQVRACPKCGKENQSTSASCFNCYTSLESVIPIESTKPEPEVPVVQPKASPEAAPPSPAAPGPAPGIGQPLNAGPAMLGDQVGPPPQGPSLDQTRQMAPPNPYGPPPPVERSYAGSRYQATSQAPARSGSAVSIIITILVIGALGFGGWWGYTKFFASMTPAQVVEKFSDPSQPRDWDHLKQYLCKSNIDTIVTMAGGEEAAAKAIDAQGRSGVFGTQKIQAGATTYEGDDTAYVQVILSSEDAAKLKMFGPNLKVEEVLVREDGKWKIDFVKTSARMMANMMQSNGGRGFPGMSGNMHPPSFGGPPSAR